MGHRTRLRFVLALIAPAYACCGAAADAAQDSLTALKKLSVDELLNLRVTTVSRGVSTLRESPAAVHVITQEDIRHSTASAIPELLRGVPGMHVARIDNNKWAVGVRGFNDRFNGKLLVQVDGRTVYNPLSSGVYWDALDYPLEEIDRIEIIRGPGASVWGANAVNGIINIIGKPAEASRGLSVSLGTGTEERYLGTVRYGGARDSLDYRAYAKAFERDAQFSSFGDSNDDWSGASAGTRIDWRRSERDVLTLQGDLLRSVARRKDLRPMPVAPFSLVNVEDETTHAANLLGRWERNPGDGSNLSLRAYADFFQRDGENGFADLRWNTFDLDFQHRAALGARHVITYGAGYRYIEALLGPSAGDNGFAVSFAPAKRHPQLFSAFVQDQIAISPDVLSLTLGSKLEHNEFTGFEFQPTLRLLWMPTDRRTAWAAISRALRTPTLSEDAIGTRQLPSFPAPGGAPLFGRLADSPDFESEELLAHEIGYRTEISGRFSFDIASFYNDYDRLRTVVPDTAVAGSVPGTFDLPLRFRNRMQAKTYGAEVSSMWKPMEGWRIRATYTYLSMSLDADAALPPGVRSSAESPERQNPQQQAWLQSSWSLPKAIEIDLTARHVDRLPGFSPAVTSYTTCDIRAGWRPSHAGPRDRDVVLTLIGRNLLDRHHAEIGTAPLLRSLSVEIERSVYAQAALTW